MSTLVAVLVTVLVFSLLGLGIVYALWDAEQLAAEQEQEALLDQLWDEAA